MNLTERFPIQFKLAQNNRARNGIILSIILNGDVQYDSYYTSKISPDILQQFIDYQSYYPSKIHECIELFCNILELQENEHNLIAMTGEPINLNSISSRKQQVQSYLDYITEILRFEYHILIGKSILAPIDDNIINDWITFIKSQSPLNAFYSLL